MITIKCINIELKTEEGTSFVNQPERVLKEDEIKTITSSSCDGVNYIYYQGDEPIQE